MRAHGGRIEQLHPGKLAPPIPIPETAQAKVRPAAAQRSASKKAIGRKK
jgi:hypothetical protein